MLKIVLLGGGNLANHLAKSFFKTKNIKLCQIYNRTLTHIKHFESDTKITDKIETIMPADIYILAVKDSAIESLSKHLQNLNGLLAHTSGAMSLKILKAVKRTGVFYPLQTFTKDREVNFMNVPICVETTNKKDEILINTLANSISNHVFKINSTQRKSLHIGAVFVNNFVNHLYRISEDLCVKNQVPFKLLHPLITETAQKAILQSPTVNQTGPALRNDIETMGIHLENLNENQKKIYTLLSEAILKTN